MRTVNKEQSEITSLTSRFAYILLDHSKIVKFHDGPGGWEMELR
jgi:hypothetical protein